MTNEQKAIACLQRMDMLNPWNDPETSAIDLSDLGCTLVTVWWEDSAGDYHTAVVRVNHTGPTVLAMYAVNVA